MWPYLTRTADILHERYDLKGSWVNRHRGRLEKGQYTTCRYCTQKFMYMEVCLSSDLRIADLLLLMWLHFLVSRAAGCVG